MPSIVHIRKGLVLVGMGGMSMYNREDMEKMAGGGMGGMGMGDEDDYGYGDYPGVGMAGYGGEPNEL